ncbi:amidohydrolase family protein [Croceicoccus hydrothermalis]|uniref:amidohydrolase family protein n=1 Tax=Croceicoccus hydrothermalis TaxID=2867964 RepID=UPI001EFB36E6|nr:amidohydrolase family protein [Croceicoccus hydrothermalis]
MKFRRLHTALFLSGAMLAFPHDAAADTQSYSVIANGENVGRVLVEIDGPTARIIHDVKNNGRGPTMEEEVTLDKDGLPLRWRLDGTSTFENAIAERFARENDGAGWTATWTDSTGSDTATTREPALYIAQEGSPWSLGIYARALLADADHAIPALPGGRLTLSEDAPVTLNGVEYRAVSINGIGLSPDTILLDADDAMFARLSTGTVVVREGYEALADDIAQIATRRGAQRFADLAKKLSHRHDAAVRVRNVRIFDPETGRVGEPASVLVYGQRIAAIEPLDSPATPGEVTIDGAGRIAMPGLHDMHAHVSQQSALLYIASGVTTVRDMGNDNAFLLDLTDRIDAGEVIGPRIVRNGFLEGRSEYSSRNGFIADSEQDAIDAVRWYAARDYWQVKIYNSMNPAWVPAIAAEAKRLGLGVTGHIPAFTDADAMIAAGYDEITHINQLMLGWVLQPDEDTRTLLRLTAMKRTAGLDLSLPRVEETLRAMEARHIALDPTAVTLELLMLSRDGEISPAVASYFDHLPIALQRRRRQGIAKIASPQDDAAYRGGFDAIRRTLAELHRRGITLLPGTDDGTGLSVHRELQIYEDAGIPPAEVLRMGTLGPATYMGRDQQYGSIAKGKRADFVLLDANPLDDMTALHRMAMVVKDGTIYYPAEIWRELGVEPFAAAPDVTLPPQTARAIAAPRPHAAHDEFAL